MPAIGMTGSKERGLAGRASGGGGGGGAEGGGADVRGQGVGRREAVALQRPSGVCTQAPCEEPGQRVAASTRSPRQPGSPAQTICCDQICTTN